MRTPPLIVCFESVSFNCYRSYTVHCLLKEVTKQIFQHIPSLRHYTCTLFHKLKIINQIIYLDNCALINSVVVLHKAMGYVNYDVSLHFAAGFRKLILVFICIRLIKHGYHFLFLIIIIIIHVQLHIYIFYKYIIFSLLFSSTTNIWK